MLIIQIKCTAFRPFIITCGEEKRHFVWLCSGLYGSGSKEMSGVGFSQELGAEFLCMASWVAAQVFIHYINRRLTSL